MSELKILDGNESADQECGKEIPHSSVFCASLDEHQLSGLFQGYFNNKMTLLVLLIQIKRFRLNEKSVQLACEFLDDLYRHMLPHGLQKKYRRVFLWLRKFFLKLPDVTTEQRSKAGRFIRSLYDVFGINLNTGGRT